MTTHTMAKSSKIVWSAMLSDGSEPRLGSGLARGSPFFGGLGLDILKRAQARARLGLDFLRRAQKIGAFME